MNNIPITVQENSQDVDLSFDPSEEDVNYLHSDNFRRGSRRNIKISYDFDRNPKITVGPYAGIVQLSKQRIHFSTKVNARLFYMLSFLKNEDEFLFDPDTPIEIKDGANFFDIIGRFFLKELEEILKKGLLRKFVRTQENTRYLKGKILIKEQIKHNLIDKSKFFCEYENLTFNNIENQLVLSALNSLISLIRFNQQIKNELKRLEVILQDFVTLVNLSPYECKKLKFNRINQHYEDIIRLSKLILEERFIRSVHKGKSRGFNFIVKMNKVYQDFITEIIEELISAEFNNYQIEKQPKFNRLVEEKSIITKPDIVLRQNNNEYPFIIDTKYKKDPTNADYYQVIAYSLALRKCKACCLIYPESERSKIEKENAHVLTLVRDLTGKDPSKVKLHARTVDLYLKDNEDIEFEQYIERIREQVKKILVDFITMTE